LSLKTKGHGQVFLTATHLGIAMEYAAGGELFDRIVKAGRFSEDEARFFFQQLISGVQYCHEQVSPSHSLSAAHLGVQYCHEKATPPPHPLHCTRILITMTPLPYSQQFFWNGPDLVQGERGSLIKDFPCAGSSQWLACCHQCVSG